MTFVPKLLFCCHSSLHETSDNDRNKTIKLTPRCGSKRVKVSDSYKGSAPSNFNRFQSFSGYQLRTLIRPLEVPYSDQRQLKRSSP